MTNTFRIGDVVYAEGSSAILGDVKAVNELDDGEQEVWVVWRETATVELASDLEIERSAE